MRVLLTTDTVGGVWTYTKVLTEGLLKHGHSVALVSFGASPSVDQLSWTVRQQNHSRNAFRYIPSSLPLEWMPENDHVYQAGVALLQHVASEFQPDLLHANQFCFGNLDLDIPRLVVAHSDVLSWAEACAPAGLPASAWLDRYIHLVQSGLDGATMLVAPTEWMLHAVAAHFTLPPQQQVIANGCTLPELDLTVPRSKQAVTAGRMGDPSKNLAALCAVRGCPVLIAGTSSHDAQTSDLPATISLLGFLPEHDLFHLFRDSRIYIAASLYEPFGLAPLEAALCGCAIVAHDIASFREVWGSAALYFRTPAELEQHLDALLNDDTFFTQRQALSLQQARTYSADAMSANYIDLYTDLLSTPSSTRHTRDQSCTYAS